MGGPARWPLPPPLPSPGERRALDAEARRYLLVVRRLRAGAPVIVFDGAGWEADAQLVESADGLCLSVASSPRPALPLAPLTLCYALPKGEKLDRVLRQATELGVGQILLLRAERSVARPDAARAARKRSRWLRIVQQATRQCGGAAGPGVEGPVDLSEALRRTAGSGSRLVLHPGSPGLSGALSPAVALFVGPEGGWSDQELSELAAAGVRRIGLGARTLRTETAATVGSALVLHRLGVL